MFINDFGYQLVLRKLCRYGLDDSKHLLHQHGSVPCIDAETWEKHKKDVDEIYIRTKKGKVFRAKAKVFDNCKQEIDLGFGKQYYMEAEYWTIFTPPPKTMEPNKPSQLFLASIGLSNTKPPEEAVDWDEVERQIKEGN